MAAVINNSFGGTTDAKIAIFEKKHELRLPADYKAFLKSFNGGVPTPRSVHVPKLRVDIFVDIFFGIGLKNDLDLETWLNEYRTDMPRGCLIIGADPGSNFLLLADGQVENGVFYWDHTFTFPGSNENQNTYPLALSFSQFLSELK